MWLVATILDRTAPDPRIPSSIHKGLYSKKKNWAFIFLYCFRKQCWVGRKMRGGRELEKSENKTWSESAHNSLIPDQSHKQLQEWVTATGWTEAKRGKEKSWVKQEDLLCLIWLCAWGLGQIPTRHQLELNFHVDLRPWVEADGSPLMKASASGLDWL